METFYISVISVASVLFFITLITFSFLIFRNSKNEIYPPILNDCPDYWINNGDTCIVPVNNINVGYDITALKDPKLTPGANGNEINFSDPAWATSDINVTCAKKKWANKFGILWDGVSNYNSC